MILPAFQAFLDAMGLPWVPEKTEPPASVMTLLDLEFRLEIDTVRMHGLHMEIRLPKKRLGRLRQVLSTALSRPCH